MDYMEFLIVISLFIYNEVEAAILTMTTAQGFNQSYILLSLFPLALINCLIINTMVQSWHAHAPWSRPMINKPWDKSLSLVFLNHSAVFKFSVILILSKRITSFFFIIRGVRPIEWISFRHLQVGLVLNIFPGKFAWRCKYFLFNQLSA